MTSHGYDLEREYAVVRKLLEHRVDGVALIGLEHSQETYRMLEQQALPAVAIWNFDAGIEDFMRWGAEFRRWVKWRRSIWWIWGIATLVWCSRILAAMIVLRIECAARWTVFAAAGIDIPETRKWVSPYSVAQAKAVCAELLGGPIRRPTALLCGNDVIAQGCVYAAAQTGVGVPSELSVVGIGDFKGSKEMEPSLTTVRIPARTIGEKAGGIDRALDRRRRNSR